MILKCLWAESETSPKETWKLLRTTSLAQSTSQYCFVLQALHKVTPSTTLITSRWQGLASKTWSLSSCVQFEAFDDRFLQQLGGVQGLPFKSKQS
jgi:hypothetical protein